MSQRHPWAPSLKRWSKSRKSWYQASCSTRSSIWTRWKTCYCQRPFWIGTRSHRWPSCKHWPFWSLSRWVFSFQRAALEERGVLAALLPVQAPIVCFLDGIAPCSILARFARSFHTLARLRICTTLGGCIGPRHLTLPSCERSLVLYIHIIRYSVNKLCCLVCRLYLRIDSPRLNVF